MGILNLTPDSFSDGGELFDGASTRLDQVLQRARSMKAAGAEMLDLGGESTRPGAEPVSVQQELDRVMPALKAIKAEIEIAVSIDTSRPEIIREAATAGADLINDVRALRLNGALEAARQSGLPVCLMHMQGTPGTMQNNPHYRDVVSEVFGWLAQRATDCERAGIPSNRILLDPGFGFGKTLTHNLKLLDQLNKLVDLGYPVLAGLSRKRMVGEITGRSDPQDRLPGSLALAQCALDRGARVIRCHDVAATCDMMRVWNALEKTKNS